MPRRRANQIMSIPEILGLFVLAASGWFVWDSLRVREAANAAMRAACKVEGLLFLDDTVALESIWPVRNDEGQLTLRQNLWLRVQRHWPYAAQGPHRNASGHRIHAGHRSAVAAGGDDDPLTTKEGGASASVIANSEAVLLICAEHGPILQEKSRDVAISGASTMRRHRSSKSCRELFLEPYFDQRLVGDVARVCRGLDSL